MFEKILYPTDFSDVARKALEYIIQLKDAGAKEVVVLHVIDQRNIDALSEIQTKDVLGVIQGIEGEAEKNAGSVRDELERLGFKAKVRVEKGNPLSEILRIEDEEKISAIVIGSHGKSNISEMLLGSVSEKVVRKAKKPVLVVKR